MNIEHQEQLFETETASDVLRSIKDSELVEIYKWARERIGKCPESWTAEDEYLVRERLVGDFGKELAGLDPTMIGPRFVRVRQNKALRIASPDFSVMDRLNRILVDAERDSESHDVSEEYLRYLQSEEWRTRANNHKRLCDYRCQICDCEQRLDTHHTSQGYRNLGQEEVWHLISCCRKCHQLLDCIRRNGWAT